MKKTRAERGEKEKWKNYTVFKGGLYSLRCINNELRCINCVLGPIIDSCWLGVAFHLQLYLNI